MKEYQVTLICKSGKYKPVSCIVKKDPEELQRIGKEEYTRQVKKAGVIKICQKRNWCGADLKRYDYTGVKIREYDPEKIKAEAEARYEAIKEAKYASGEWKRPMAKV